MRRLILAGLVALLPLGAEAQTPPAGNPSTARVAEQDVVMKEAQAAHAAREAMFAKSKAAAAARQLSSEPRYETKP